MRWCTGYLVTDQLIKLDSALPQIIKGPKHTEGKKPLGTPEIPKAPQDRCKAKAGLRSITDVVERYWNPQIFRQPEPPLLPGLPVVLSEPPLPPPPHTPPGFPP